VFGLRSFWDWGHGWVPVEEATATVAGEQLALAKLIPRLRPDAHAAAGALLVVDAGDSGAAGAGEAIVADEHFGLDERAERLALSVESDQFGGMFLLAEGNAGSGIVEDDGLGFNLGAGGGERGFLGFSALEAGKFFILEAIGLRGFKGNFVLDGVGLLWSFHGVELRAEAGGLLAMGGDFAIETGAERLLAGESGRGFGGLALSGGQCGFGLGDLRRKRAQGESETGTLQVDTLQLYEIFNLRFHR
jgi:hypothetical protein